MHATVGISIKPWLVTTRTTVVAASSVGSFSKWTASAASLDFRMLWPSTRVDGRVLGCHYARGMCNSTLERPVDTLLGVKPRNEWGWKRRHAGLKLVLPDSVKDERALVHTRARRGFLTELQNLKDEEETSTAGSVEFESPLQIVLYPDPRLRNKNSRVTVFDEKLQQLVKEMFEIMYKTDGVGLAAPQVGVNVQLMLYNPEGEKGKGSEYILVNPKIVKYSKQREIFREGCLSFLTLEADVERPYSVRVEAQDIRGKKFGISLKGWQARIFQHEYDHLEGVLYHDRMTPSQVDTIRAGLVKLEEAYEKQSGVPRPEKVQ